MLRKKLMTALLMTLFIPAMYVFSNHIGANIPIGDRYAVVYYGTLNNWVIRSLANRGYRIFILSSNYGVPHIKGVLMLGYLNILGLPVRMLDKVKKEHPEWILYTSNGKPALYWFSYSFMCNIAEKSFQDYLINRSKKILSMGFNGIFLDDLHKDISEACCPPYYDTPVYNKTKYGDWWNATVTFIKRLKKELNTTIIYNAGWSAPDPKIMKVVDGVLLESHPGSWRGTVNNPTYYFRDWNDIYRKSLISTKIYC